MDLSGDAQYLAGTSVAGRYRLTRHVAQGGMGTVWVGLDEKLGREVALKVMAHGLVGHPELMARFEREAKAVAQLRSTHVVEVYDYGLQDSLPFIVMELLQGESLRERLRRVGRLPLRDAAIISDQIAKGLKAAHTAGLVHRDLKPSNVFIAVRDDVEIVKLLDFGVVKAIDSAGHSDMTASGTLLGTPQYMSPEQVRARRQVDPRSDLWSLGVIVFRMLTGINPFRGESVGDAALRICSDELPRIADYCDDLPHTLDGFFAKAFARDPDRRFQTADELAMAFRTVCAQAMSGASPPVTNRSAPQGAPPLMPPAGYAPSGDSASGRIGGALPAPPIAAGAAALAVAGPVASATPPPMVRRLPHPVSGESHTPISVSGVVLPPAAPPPMAGRISQPGMHGSTPSTGLAPNDTAATRLATPVSLPDEDSSGVQSSSSPWNVATRKMPPLEERLAAARAAGVPLPAALAALAAADGASQPGSAAGSGSGSFSDPRSARTPSSMGLAIPGTSIPLPAAGTEGPPSVFGTLSLPGELRALRLKLLQSPMALVIGVAATVFLGGILAVMLLTPDDPPDGPAPATVISGRFFNPSWTRLTKPPSEDDAMGEPVGVVRPADSAEPMGSSAPTTTTEPSQRGKTPGGSKPTKPKPKWF